MRKEHAINLLRRFYVQDNPNAPDTRRKTGRELRLLPESDEHGEGETQGD